MHVEKGRGRYNFGQAHRFLKSLGMRGICNQNFPHFTKQAGGGDQLHLCKSQSCSQYEFQTGFHKNLAFLHHMRHLDKIGWFTVLYMDCICMYINICILVV